MQRAVKVLLLTLRDRLVKVVMPMSLMMMMLIESPLIRRPARSRHDDF